MISQEKVELAKLLEEKMFRRERFKLETVTQIIDGIEQKSFLVKLKLRPAHIMAKMAQR